MDWLRSGLSLNEDPTVRITDVSGNGRDLLPTVGTAATTTGLWAA